MDQSDFARQSALIRKNLKRIGCTNIQFKKGYYYFSGFFTAPNGQEYYLCTSDTRGPSSLYYRGVRHRKDYTGFVNQWLTGRSKEDFDKMKFYTYN